MSNTHTVRIARNERLMYDRNMTRSDSKAFLTIDEAIGATLNQHMFFAGWTRVQVGSLVGLTGQTVGRKLKGLVSWSASELLIIQLHMGLNSEDIMPTPDGNGGWLPAQVIPGKANAPAFAEALSVGPAGLEPATHGLKVRCSTS